MTSVNNVKVNPCLVKCDEKASEALEKRVAQLEGREISTRTWLVQFEKRLAVLENGGLDPSEMVPCGDHRLETKTRSVRRR